MFGNSQCVYNAYNIEITCEVSIVNNRLTDKEKNVQEYIIRDMMPTIYTW